MAETSGFWTTSGTPSGHQVASYTQAIAAKAWAILAACAAKEGVAPGYLNECAGSVPGANTARIATGGAVVDGQWYENGANVDVTIPSAVGGGNTRIDRIVLRCSWANFEVEITRIAGTDAASPTAPAITQTPGTTYDIMLYQVLVNTSGVVTLTDERVWANTIYNRQGGSATDWFDHGTTDYEVSDAKIQFGSKISANGGGDDGQILVTFPEAFSAEPIVICQPYAASTVDITFIVGTVSSTQFAGRVWYNDAYANNVVVFWLAIGPK